MHQVIIRPMVDGIFKYLFGYQKNIKFTEYLLECLFNLEPGTLNGKVNIKNSLVLDKYYYYEHGFETDIRIEIKDYDDKDILVDIEAYTSYDKTSIVKSFLYIAKLFVSQFQVGNNYKNPQRLYQFNLIQGKKQSRDYGMLSKDSDYKELFKNLIKKDIFEYKEIFLEDKELSKKYDERAIRLYKFLNSKDMNEAKKNAEGDDMLMEMYAKANNFVDDEDWSWIDKLYFETRESEAFAEGEKSGFTKGEKSGFIQTTKNIAKNFLNLGFKKQDISKL